MAADLEALEQETDPESSAGSGYLERVVAGPGVSLLAMALVSLATWTAFQAGGDADPFRLQAPLTEDWWQLPLSVFAHADMAHLTGNAMLIAVFGSAVVLFSSLIRYHLFFVVAGMLAGASQIVALEAFGDAAPVLGASGAALALLAYALTSNSISTWILGHVPRWVVAFVVLTITLALTLRFAGLNIANVGHFTGALIGAVAGHFNLLRAD